MATPRNGAEWWREAVIYQVYPRSFADANGDGVGDLAGVRAHLPYLRDLGVDAIWFTPWYPSPMADGGYDVADYRAIDPAFGTLAEAGELIADALTFGIRTVVDVVPNHISDQHAWFQAALAAGPGSPERERFWFRPGRGDDGDEPPNGWSSIFGGPAWTRVPDGDWYLHLFAPEQPDLNWQHPDVWREHEDVLRFWFDRGAAGVRIDSAALPVKDPTLPELADNPAPGQHPYEDRDELHDIYRSWRRVADSYADPRVLIGEIWLPDTQRFARYLRPDELHTAFNFDFLACPWDARRLRESIDTTLAAHAPVNAPATWVLSNHDVTRHVTRYGRADTSFSFADRQHLAPTNRALGLRRARAAALLSLSLPGAVYIYQGEELGLSEVEDLPDEVRQDPVFARTSGADIGRDGCRVPLPWSGDAPPFGFNAAGTAPWLPQPSSWSSSTVEREADDPDSMLALYRRALALRRGQPALGDGPLTWLAGQPDGVLAFSRGADFACVVNLSAAPIALPEHREILLTSDAVVDTLPPDTAAWLRI
jgi:alpha-glucosidase